MAAGHVVYIGIGSNLDDPIAHVRRALQQLAELPLTSLSKTSSLYSSKPLGPADQPDYINAVASIRTELAPLELLDELHRIEAEHGRVRTGARWGPRPLDLDILLYDEKVITLERLVIPHPGLHERGFVLYPLHEINPALIIPQKGSVMELRNTCVADGLEKIAP